MKVQKEITELIINSFILLLVLISSVNIFNTIYSSIVLRKKEFAIFKSIGTSNKQINKMIFFEGLFYGIESLVYGIAISIGILFLMYILMIDTAYNSFNVPWINIIICIVCTYSIVFISIYRARNRIKEKNIIDEVKSDKI